MNVYKVTHFTTDRIHKLLAMEAAKAGNAPDGVAYKCEADETGISVCVFDAPQVAPTVEVKK